MKHLTKQRLITLVGVAVILAAVGTAALSGRRSHENWKSLQVEEGPFLVTVPATASIQPENKIVVMPPVPGRIDQLMVDEGSEVEVGQILAWMSSTDRAALLDAARAQGKSAESEWANVYKPTPILSPVKGRIISRGIVSGQTVNQSTALFEISDHLVIRAQVDETDIGKIGLGQKALVRVDAFPDQEFPARVSRIGHQSILSNSINVYEVMLTPDQLPKLLRSGMTATVNFVLLEKKTAPLLPAWIAGGRQNATVEVTVRGPQGQTEKREVKVGLSNGDKVEILGNLGPSDTILYLPIKLSSEGAGGILGMLGGKKKAD